jgi:hypothetical protein
MFSIQRTPRFIQIADTNMANKNRSNVSLMTQFALEVEQAAKMCILTIPQTMKNA